MELTTAKGWPSAAYAYGPWGESAQIALAANRFRFTGEELDDFGGLYYLRARWYDPRIRRFLNRDPWPGTVWSPKTRNRYSYVLNNPTNVTDPTGQEPQPLSLSQVAGAAAGTGNSSALRALEVSNYSFDISSGLLAIQELSAGLLGEASGFILDTLFGVAQQTIKDPTTPKDFQGGVQDIQRIAAAGPGQMGADEILQGNMTIQEFNEINSN